MNVRGRALDHIGLISSDVERDVKFYCEELGFRVTGAFGPIRFIQNGSTAYEILPGRNLPEGTPSMLDHVSYVSGDIEADYEYVKSLGLEILGNGIMDIPFFWEKGCRCFKFRAPGGEVLEFDQIL